MDSDLSRHVWIIPDYTAETLVASTSFRVVHDERNDLRDDLGDGTGKLYRRLIPVSQPDIPDKISVIRLLRSTDAIAHPADGYDGISDNLNATRDGTERSYLYVIWKTGERIHYL